MTEQSQASIFFFFFGSSLLPFIQPFSLFLYIHSSRLHSIAPSLLSFIPFHLTPPSPPRHCSQRFRFIHFYFTFIQTLSRTKQKQMPRMPNLCWAILVALIAILATGMFFSNPESSSVSWTTPQSDSFMNDLTPEQQQQQQQPSQCNNVI
jgi:hypothetical protein